MELDWRSIAGAVAPFAPKIGTVIGTALGGPLGGGIGAVGGQILARYLGTEATPDAVGKAIAEDKRAPEKLALADKEEGDRYVAWAQVEIERLKQRGETDRANVAEVNATIRAELTAHNGTIPWWHWRHQLGNVVALEILVFPAAALATILFGSPEKTAAIIAFSGTLVGILTIGAGLLGYVAQDTSAVKVAAMTGQPVPGILATAMKGITGGGKK